MKNNNIMMTASVSVTIASLLWLLATVSLAAAAQNEPTQQMLTQIKQLQQSDTNTGSNVRPNSDATPYPQAGSAATTTTTTTTTNTSQQTQQRNPASQGQLYANVRNNRPNPASSQATAHALARRARAQAQAQAQEPPPSNFTAPFGSQHIRLSQEEKSIHTDAFSKMAQTLLPMSPQQIHRLKQLYSASQYAAATPAGEPPRVTAIMMPVDLSPDATPPAINLAEGEITALVFLDQTYAPWPIAAYFNADPTAFNIGWNKTDNVLMIQPLAAFAKSNLAVRLRGFDTPIMIDLVTNTTVANGGGTVNSRVDLRIPGYGPKAKPPPITGLPSQASPVLLNVLNGVPPKGSKQLTMVGDMVLPSDNETAAFTAGLGQAWMIHAKLFVRTPLTLLSPGWLSTMSSADGTHAYELEKTPRLLMSQHGKIIHVQIKGFD